MADVSIDASPRQTSILNVKSDHTPVSAAYHEFDGDGLPAVQARRGDYDVNRCYTYDDAPTFYLSPRERSREARVRVRFSREAAALHSLARKHQVGGVSALVSPVGTTQDPSVPRLQRSMSLGAMIPWGRAQGCDVPPLRG